MVDIAQHPRLSRPVLPSVMLGREGWAQLGWRLSMVGADNLVYRLSSVRFVISSRYLASLMFLAVEADVLFHCLRNMQIAEVVAVLSNTSYAAVLMFFLFFVCVLLRSSPEYASYRWSGDVFLREPPLGPRVMHSNCS